jgi:hypothetical protein
MNGMERPATEGESPVIEIETSPITYPSWDREPNVRPELLRLVKRGTQTNATKADVALAV